jgi:hypothetical protein
MRHFASSKLYTHSAYWRSTELVDAVRAALPRPLETD